MALSSSLYVTGGGGSVRNWKSWDRSNQTECRSEERLKSQVIVFALCKLPCLSFRQSLQRQVWAPDHQRELFSFTGWARVNGTVIIMWWDSCYLRKIIQYQWLWSVILHYRQRTKNIFTVRECFRLKVHIKIWCEHHLTETTCVWKQTAHWMPFLPAVCWSNEQPIRWHILLWYNTGNTKWLKWYKNSKTPFLLWVIK